MRRLIAAGALAVLASAGAASASAATPSSPPNTGPSQNRVGIRQVTIPFSQRNNPRDRLYIIQHVAPGTVIHRLIQVANQSPKPVVLRIYPAAASISHGHFLFAAGHTQNLLTTWVTVSRPLTRLAPHQPRTLEVTIRVPRNASPGEQYGVIWAEDHGIDPGHSKIMLVSRVGVRIYLSVGPGGPPPSDFTVAAPDARHGPNGHPVVTTVVDNTGGSALDIGGTISLSGGPGGLRAGPFPSSAATVAPGQSATITFTLGRGLPDGPWQAAIKLQSGLIVRTESATIDFGTAVTSHSTPVALTAGLAATLIMIALGALVIRARRTTSASRHQHREA